MKKITLLLLLAFLSTNAQDWETFGEEGFSEGSARDITLKINSIGVPYVAYLDITTDTTWVKKFENGNWVPVGGTAVTQDGSPVVSFALSNDDIPYIAFRDDAHGNKLTVMKYDGGSWQILGTAGLSTDAVTTTSISLDSSGIPYVAYELGGGYHESTVIKFVNNTWQAVGPSPLPQEVGYPSIGIDENDILYIAYRNNNYKTTVKKFENGNWQLVGIDGFSSNNSYGYTLDFNSNNIPYLAYSHHFISNDDIDTKSTVMKFDNNTWHPVGEEYITPGSSWYTSFTLNGNNIPYISFMDFAHGSKASVMKFNGNSWEYVGMPGFSQNTCSYINIAIDGNGVAYAAFSDGANAHKIKVMKYDATTRVKQQELKAITLYPNPADNEVTITNLPDMATLTVTDMTGKVLNQLTNQGLTTLNTSGFANGVYLVEITTANESTVKKLVVDRQ